jgi:universal stress protein A
MLPFKKILCPIDFSEASYETLRSAVELALHFKAELCLVHVTPKVHSIPPDPFYVFKGPEEYEQEQKTADENELQKVIEQHVPNDIAVQTVVKEGDMADEIVRVAQSEGADLIIITTHGLSGWRHTVYGSTAEKVVRHAPCAVLIRRIASSAGD